MENPDALHLGQQICFPLYALSREITGLYRPLLEELDMTYPQYLVMMVLWEEDGPGVCDIGRKLFLDSGTLTPLLKRLEAKGFIVRKRNTLDERVVQIFLTDSGKALREKAGGLPARILEKIDLETGELQELKESINKILNKIQK
ncbi:MAG: MarR family transcriptional regulator [Weeksellaceae bacterium]|nr:MarR family transcriptional regulator [Weeksellaceae bacterium]